MFKHNAHSPRRYQHYSSETSFSNLFLVFVAQGGGGHKVHRATGTFIMDQPTKDTAVPVSMPLLMPQDRCPGQESPSIHTSSQLKTDRSVSNFYHLRKGTKIKMVKLKWSISFAHKWHISTFHFIEKSCEGFFFFKLITISNFFFLNCQWREKYVICRALKITS